MRNLIRAAIVFFSLTFSCLAQTPFVPGDAAAPKYGLPGPICATDLAYLMTPEPYSSFDQHNGWLLGWSFAKQCFTIEPPKLAIGPGNIPSDIALAQNTFTFLDGAIGSGGGPGFRAGAQYPPTGVWTMSGFVTVLTTTANSLYEVEVTLGQSIGAQATILTGSPTVVGGGGNNCPTAGAFCQIGYIAPKISCGAGYGQSCEVRTLVRTTDAAGTAKIKTTNLPNNIVTVDSILRVGGPDALQ